MKNNSISDQSCDGMCGGRTWRRSS